MSAIVDISDMDNILGFIKNSLSSIDLTVEINSRIVTEVISKLAIAAHIENNINVRDEALNLLKEINECVMRSGSEYSKVYSAVMLANALIYIGDLDGAKEVVSSVKELTESLDGLSGVTAIADVAEAMIRCGLVDEGRKLLFKSEALAKGLDDLEEQVLGLSYVSLVASLTRDLVLASRALKEALRSAKALGKSLSGRLVEELSNAVAELSRAGAVDEAANIGSDLISLVSSFADMEHYLPVLEALGSVNLIEKRRIKEVLDALLANINETLPKDTGSPTFEISMKLFHYVTIARVAARVGLINYSLQLLGPFKEIVKDMDVVTEGSEALSTMIIPIIPHLPVIAEVLGNQGMLNEAREVLEIALKVANKASAESYIAKVIGPEVIEASKGLTYIGVIRVAGKLGLNELANEALSKIGEVGVALMAFSSLLTAKYGL